MGPRYDKIYVVNMSILYPFPLAAKSIIYIFTGDTVVYIRGIGELIGTER